MDWVEITFPWKYLIVKMDFCQKLIVLLGFLCGFSWENSFTSGEEIVTVTEDAPCLRGNNLTLTCELKERNSVVRWMCVDDGKSIVACSRNRCYFNQDYKGQYNHSCDPANNVFNLTVLNVDEDDNGRKLVCSDGTNSGCKILNIGGLEETENGTITASSDCLDKRVSFQWIKIDVFRRKEVKFEPRILSQNNKTCSNECGKGKYMKYMETVSAVTSGNGTKYYLKVEMIYGNKRILSKRSPVPYIIEERATFTKSEESEGPRVDIFAVVSGVIIAVILIAASVAIFWIRRVIRVNRIFFKRDEKSQEEKVEEKSFIDSDINEEGSAVQEKAKGRLETKRYCRSSGDMYTDRNSNDNKGNDSVDMKEGVGNAMNGETLPKMYLLEEDDKGDDDYEGAIKDIIEEGSAVQEKAKGRLETKRYCRSSGDMYTDRNSNDNQGNLTKN